LYIMELHVGNYHYTHRSPSLLSSSSNLIMIRSHPGRQQVAWSFGPLGASLES
jgi:hypothetical protein